MKNKKQFTCSNCGYVSPSWLGKCPECMEWNSFDEEVISKSTSSRTVSAQTPLASLADIPDDEQLVISSGSSEIDQFLGEGLIKGAVYLLSGEPGVGKSTLLLHIAQSFKGSGPIFYYSGEESQAQVKKRCNRLSIDNEQLFLSNTMITETIIDECNEKKPSLVFIDSIQTIQSSRVDSAGGTVSQVKQSTALLLQMAKENGITVLLVGHVTKSGEIGGPRLLEHMVDVVLYFESDYKYQYRILRSIKNRYGNTDEIVLFEMNETGLDLVSNPSIYFIQENNSDEQVGKCRSVILEGRRPLIVEIEALVVPSIYAYPRRFSEGVDGARVSRIAAILDKHAGENLHNYDIYINITGGVKTRDISLDLALAMALYSSKNKKSMTGDTVCLGELSLTGKIRSVPRLPLRIHEAEKMGTRTIVRPENSENSSTDSVKTIQEAISLLFS
jgi:DNA repair protein RadA/Sms